MRLLRTLATGISGATAALVGEGLLIFLALGSAVVTIGFSWERAWWVGIMCASLWAGIFVGIVAAAIAGAKEGRRR